MRLLFCNDPLSPRNPDPAFEREVVAARALGIPFDLVDHDALVAGKPPRLPALPHPALVVYRGWMMKPAQYARLHQTLSETGRQLINDPAQYAHCHHLPRSFELISGHSPQTAWLPTRSMPPMDELMRLLAPFEDRPIIVKDYVKSQKHAWKEACFIPCASDRPRVERVVRRFVELQAESLEEGLVFREFVELARVGTHPKSGMPLSREFRLFFLDGAPVFSTRYWDEAEYENESALPGWIEAVGHQVQSRFFTMDLARTTSGEWLIVELGDGQVSGIPDAADPSAFFQAVFLRPVAGASGLSHAKARTPQSPQ